MVKPVFSEFSYGFALTHELVNRFGASVVGAPVLPSLISEGTSGGYDVGVPVQGWTIFLQFKASQYMKRRSAMHWDEYGHPYFRFPIRPATYSGQHRLLLELARQVDVAHFVAYVAPAFHELHELNEHFLTRRVAEQSVWVPVLAIGNIQDNEQHWVIYDGIADAPRFRSEIGPTLQSVKGDRIGHLFAEGPQEVDKVLLDEAFFNGLSLRMAAIGSEQILRETLSRMKSDGYSAAAICGYLARTLFDSELLLALGDA